MLRGSLWRLRTTERVCESDTGDKGRFWKHLLLGQKVLKQPQRNKLRLVGNFTREKQNEDFSKYSVDSEPRSLMELERLSAVVKGGGNLEDAERQMGNVIRGLSFPRC